MGGFGDLCETYLPLPEGLTHRLAFGAHTRLLVGVREVGFTVASARLLLGKRVSAGSSRSLWSSPLRVEPLRSPVRGSRQPR